MENYRHHIKWMWNASAGFRMSILLIGFVSVLSVAVSLFHVWVSKHLVDIATGAAQGRLAIYIALLASCALVQLLFYNIISRLETKSEVSIRNSLK